MGVTERREREREKRRLAIIEAGQRVMARDGLDGTTMDTIAAEAELSKGTLYLYFRSREGLVAAIGEQRLASLLQTLEPQLRQISSGLAGVHAILAAYAAHFNQTHFRLFLSWTTSATADDDTSPSFRAYRERLGALVALKVATIERGIKDGSIRSDVDPQMTAMLLWGEFLGVAIMSFNRHRIEMRLPEYSPRVDHLLPCHVDGVLRKLATPRARIPNTDGLRFAAPPIELSEVGT